MHDDGRQTNDDIALNVHQLTKTYPSGSRTLTVLKDITFSLNYGDTCAVTGASGSGKTTLLGLCAGLDRPASGDVELCGEDLGGLSENDLARLRSWNAGFMFQTFQLIPTLTALENVMAPLELRGESSARKDAAELLGRVGLADRLDHYPAQLSGGGQQRVAMARAFVHRPRILFADEPTGNLDEDTSNRIESLLFDLNRTAGTTLLLVTHDAKLAGMTERVLQLKGGKLVGDTSRFSTKALL